MAGGSDAPGPQYLLDGPEQPVAVLHHGAIKLLPFPFVHRSRLQRFQIKPYGGDGRLQFMRDGIDERVVLFVSPDFAYQKGRVQHHRHVREVPR